MYPDGINNRGLSNKYNKHQLKITNLIGYKRSFNARFVNTKENDMGYKMGEANYFLGVVPVWDKASLVKGVMFWIPDDDMEVFKKSEASASNLKEPMYDMVDVSAHIGSAGQVIRWNQKVLTCVPRHTKGPGIVNQWYIQNVLSGIKECWGINILKNFIETTTMHDGKTLVKDVITDVDL